MALPRSIGGFFEPYTNVAIALRFTSRMRLSGRRIATSLNPLMRAV
jgi:hypothetical protein